MKQAIVDLTTRKGKRDDIINLSKVTHIRRYGKWVLIFYTAWRWFVVKFDEAKDAGDAISDWAKKMRSVKESEN